MGEWLSLWAHWGIFKRSDLDGKKPPRHRLVLALVMIALAGSGGAIMAATNSFAIGMGIFGAAVAVFLLGVFPVYALHVAKQQDAAPHKP